MTKGLEYKTEYTGHNMIVWVYTLSIITATPSRKRAVDVLIHQLEESEQKKQVRHEETLASVADLNDTLKKLIEKL